MPNVAPPFSLRITPLPNRGLISLDGPDTRNFLQNLVSNDIRKVAAHRAIYALLLTPQGKFMHDFFILEQPDEQTDTSILVECERSRVEDLVRRLTLYRLRADVVIKDLTEHYHVYAAFGSGVFTALGLESSLGFAKTSGRTLSFVDPRLSELGARVIAPADQKISFSGAETASSSDYDMFRLALGIPDGSRDMETERTLPLEAGLEDLNAIDYGKGCYVGQELTARTHYRGTLRKRLFPVAVQGPLPESGTDVMLGGRLAGELRSGQDGRALALLRLEQVEESQRTGIPLKAGSVLLTPETPNWMRFRDKAESP